MWINCGCRGDAVRCAQPGGQGGLHARRGWSGRKSSSPAKWGASRSRRAGSLSAAVVGLERPGGDGNHRSAEDRRRGENERLQRRRRSAPKASRCAGSRRQPRGPTRTSSAAGSISTQCTTPSLTGGWAGSTRNRRGPGGDRHLAAYRSGSQGRWKRRRGRVEGADGAGAGPAAEDAAARGSSTGPLGSNEELSGSGPWATTPWWMPCVPP